MRAQPIPHLLLSHYKGLKTVLVDGITNSLPDVQLPHLPLGKYFGIQFEDLSFILMAGRPDVSFSIHLDDGDDISEVRSLFVGLTCRKVTQKLTQDRICISFKERGASLCLPYFAEDCLYLGNPIAAKYEVLNIAMPKRES
jgi:hypothetical protein